MDEPTVDLEPGATAPGPEGPGPDDTLGALRAIGALDDLEARRARLRAAPLDERRVDQDPIIAFDVWFRDAQAAAVPFHDAMVLATVAADGTPTARTVLLRIRDGRGFGFYTNLESDKALDLAQLPRAALAFHWRELERQVRIVGDVVRVADDEADAYWATRPRGHRISAWASPQSDVLADRGALDRLVAEAETRWADVDPPRPSTWGGFVVRPDGMELWAGRSDRRHDRVRWRWAAAGWVVERLAP